MFVFSSTHTETHPYAQEILFVSPAWSLLMPLLLVQSIGNFSKSDLDTPLLYFPCRVLLYSTVFHSQLLFSVSSAAVHLLPSLKWCFWAGVNLLHWPKNNKVNQAPVLMCLLLCFACCPILPAHLWHMNTLFLWGYCLIWALRRHHKVYSTRMSCGHSPSSCQLFKLFYKTICYLEFQSWN